MIKLPDNPIILITFMSQLYQLPVCNSNPWNTLVDFYRINSLKIYEPHPH